MLAKGLLFEMFWNLAGDYNTWTNITKQWLGMSHYINMPLIKQNKHVICCFLKALLTVSFFDYMYTTAVSLNHQQTSTNELHLVD